MFIEADGIKISDVAIHWGNKMPMMAMEEAGELIQAISKIERHCEDDDYLDYRNNLAEEIRDMFISLMALQYRYGIGSLEINEAIEQKLNKKYD